MPLSLYQVTIPPFIHGLRTLSTFLEKGRAHAAENEAGLIESRIIEDMKDLSYQIQRVSDSAKGVATRVGKAEPVVMPDTEKTFPELQERIAKTIEYLEKLEPNCMDGMEDQEVTLKTGRGEVKFTAQRYVQAFAIPNFYFHVAMAYAILRKEGVPVGKLDYLGDVYPK